MGKNLILNDKKLMDDKLVKRKENHDVSARSKAHNAKEHIPKNVEPGQFVYIRDGASKHEARNPLIVTSVDGDKVNVKKVLHSHETALKSPKITSEKIIVREKFLYVPPHKRKANPVILDSSNDSWWRKRPKTSKLNLSWVPTHRQEDQDDDWISEDLSAEISLATTFQQNLENVQQIDKETIEPQMEIDNHREE